MPKLGQYYPWRIPAQTLVRNTAAASTGYANLRSGDYFADGPANRLLSQANNQKLPVYPTLPSVFDMALVADNYSVGMRGTSLDAADNVRAWVSQKGPWLRTNRLLRRPRTLLVTSAFTGLFEQVAAALDAAWGAIDDGGWEAAVVKAGLQPAWNNFPDPFYLGLPVRAHVNTDTPTADFAGAFGELVLAHVCPYADTGGAQNSASAFPHFVSVDSTVDQENVVTVGSGTFTDSLGSHTWTVQRNALWYAAGPAFFAEVLAHYERFRLVVVNGNFADAVPITATERGAQLAEASFPADVLLRDFTGLDADHLTVLDEPFGSNLPNFGARGGARLAAWLADNLND
jgi:hypothetical protein